MREYPHQMSGGMRQRIAGAIALSAGPKVIIADEPTTSLDVTIQAQYLDLLKNLQRDTGVGLIFVTHDLEEAMSLSDRVVVMSAGYASRLIGEFAIDLPRPRDVAEIRLTPRFVELHRLIWQALRDEVQKAYAHALD